MVTIYRVGAQLLWMQIYSVGSTCIFVKCLDCHWGLLGKAAAYGPQNDHHRTHKLFGEDLVKSVCRHGSLLLYQVTVLVLMNVFLWRGGRPPCSLVLNVGFEDHRLFFSYSTTLRLYNALKTVEYKSMEHHKPFNSLS